MAGRRIDRSHWPDRGAHRQLLEHFDRVHIDSGTKSLREVGGRMTLAHSRVSAILRGDVLPVDDRQAAALVRALGGGDDEAARAGQLLTRAGKAAARIAKPAASTRHSTSDIPSNARVDQWIATALSSHWLPSVHGAPGPHGPAHRFTGRLSVIRHLVGWLSGTADHRPRVVTGRPGSGKSAVLAWTVLRSDRRWGRRMATEEGHPKLPRGLTVAAVHARGRTLSEVVAIIARQCGTPSADSEQLVRSLTSRPGHPVVVIDAVDESSDADAIVTQLVRPLARAAPNSGVRLLVGARRHVSHQIGGRWVEVLDLDAEYADPEALSRYVRQILTDDRRRSPYRDLLERASRVAEAVAERAAGSFLIGRLAALALMFRSEPADVLEQFPGSVHEAMDSYLDAVPMDRRTLEDLFRPLAHAEGFGLPQALWAELAGALCGLPGKYSLRDIDAVFAGPASSLLTATPQHEEYPVAGETGRKLYRLFHEALDECVAAIPSPNPDAPQSPPHCRQVIARTLFETARPTTGYSVGWEGADPYLRRHLAAHAAGTPLLDALVLDPQFLLAADQDRMLSALAGGVRTDQASTARAAYELAAHHLRNAADRHERAAYLALSELKEGSARVGR